MESARIGKSLDRVIEFLIYLTAAVVPAVYYNNPIATEYFFAKAFFFDFLVYLAIVLFFVRCLVMNELKVRWGLTFLPLVVFSVVVLQSLLGATNPWKGWETVVRVGAAIPFLFLMYQVVGTREGIIRFLCVAAVVNIGITGYGFLQYYEVFSLPRTQYGLPNPSSTIGLTNFVMEYLMVFMFIMPAMIIIEKRRFWRAVFIAATLFQYYYFLLSENRAAMVGWVATVPFAILLLYRQYRRGTFRFPRRIAGAFAVVLVIALTVIGSSDEGQRAINRAQTMTNIDNFDDSIQFRLETWRESFFVFADNPVRGVGMSNLEVMFPLYQSPYLQRMTLRMNTRVVRAHNEYIQVLVDLGLLGGIAFAWFMVSLIRLGRRAYKSAKEWDDFLLVSGIVLGIWAYLVVAFFAFPFEVPASSLSIFLVIGLLEIITRRVLRPEEDRAFTFPMKWTKPVAGVLLVGTLAFWMYSSNWMWNALHAEVLFKQSRVLKDISQNVERQGNRQFAMETWHEAQDMLERAIERYPTNEAYYYDRSIFSLRAGNVDEALEYLTVTAQLVPHYGMGRKQMGVLYAQKGEFDEAIKHLTAAFLVYRNYPQEYVPLLVSAYIGAGRAEEALDLVTRTLERGFVTSPEVYLAGAQVYLARNNQEDAISFLEQALELREDFVDASIFLGVAHQQAGQSETALSILNRARRSLGDSQHRTTLEMTRIKAMVSLGQFEDARVATRSLIEQEPNTVHRLRRDPELMQVDELGPLLRR